MILLNSKLCIPLKKGSPCSVFLFIFKIISKREKTFYLTSIHFFLIKHALKKFV